MIERGVYLSTFGDLTEYAAVDREGREVKRVTVLTTLMRDGDVDELVAFLDSVDPSPELRLVPAQDRPGGHPRVSRRRESRTT